MSQRPRYQDLHLTASTLLLALSSGGYCPRVQNGHPGDVSRVPQLGNRGAMHHADLLLPELHLRRTRQPGQEEVGWAESDFWPHLIHLPPSDAMRVSTQETGGLSQCEHQKDRSSPL